MLVKVTLVFFFCRLFVDISDALIDFLYFHLGVHFGHQLIADRPSYLWSLILDDLFTDLLYAFLLAMADVVHLSLVDHFKKWV